MAPTSVSEALAAIPSLPDANAKAEAFSQTLSQLRTISSPAMIKTDMTALISTIFAASLGVVATRQLVADSLAVLRSFDNHDLWLSVGDHLLALITTSPSLSTSLVEAASSARDLLATAYESQDDHAAAARILSEIPLDSSARRLDDSERARIWIRIVRNYLEVDDGVAAETYLNKLKNVMPDVADPELRLHFQLSAARIRDANRQFLAAAQNYHSISFSSAIAEEERLHTLRMAIKCAVLAPAGPPRSRVLAQLYKDERSAGVEEYGMLEKMFLDRLLAPAEVDKFAQGLAPHQLAITSDGTTVLARAVVEHNLLATSRLYLNISLDDLAVLLGLDVDRAEDTTARMIEQGRLNGTIDQIERVIYFQTTEQQEGSKEITVGREMRRWDANVQSLAENVEGITNTVQAEMPEWTAAHMAAA